MKPRLSRRRSPEGPVPLCSGAIRVLAAGLLIAGSHGAFALNTTVVGPVADATVFLDPSAPNHGADDNLAIGNWGLCGPEQVAYIKFDLSAIPPNAVILDATFSAVEYGGWNARPVPFTRAVWVCGSNDWDEWTIVGDNRPTDVAAAGKLLYGNGLAGPQPGSQRGSLVDASEVLWHAVCEAVGSADRQLTLVLSALNFAPCERGFFRSREAGADEPTLAVTWELPLIADAGPDLVLDAERPWWTEVTLGGSATGGTEPYSFTWDCNPFLSVSGQTAVYPLETGEHDARLTVVDAEGRAATDWVHITIKLPDPLVVDAGPPQTVEATSPDGALVALGGSATPSKYVAHVTWTALGIPRFGSLEWVPNVRLPLGSHTVTYTVWDVFDRAVSDTVQITVVDTTAPTIVSAVATPSVLTPADGKMKPVAIAVTATDACDPAPRTTITGVTCNESTNPRKPAWVVTGDLTLDLQATCSSTKADRVYTIALACLDASGNKSTTTAKVTVPRSKGKK